MSGVEAADMKDSIKMIKSMDSGAMFGLMGESILANGKITKETAKEN